MSDNIEITETELTQLKSMLAKSDELMLATEWLAGNHRREDCEFYEHLNNANKAAVTLFRELRAALKMAESLSNAQ